MFKATPGSNGLDWIALADNWACIGSAEQIGTDTRGINDMKLDMKLDRKLDQVGILTGGGRACLRQLG